MSWKANRQQQPSRGSAAKGGLRLPSSVGAARTDQVVAGNVPPSRRFATLNPRSLLRLQRVVGNRSVGNLLRTPDPSGGLMIQRTVDQDARRYSMDWLATRGRPFVAQATQLGLPKLSGIIDGVLGNPHEPGPAPTREDRAKYTTALASALVSLGEEEVGKLAARLADNKPGLKELMLKLEEAVADVVPDLALQSAQTQADFEAVKSQIPDPFEVLKLGGAQFTFSKAMAEHMLRRHHPAYLSGDPMQVQSFFAPDTTITAIRALVEGTIMTQAALVKEWRAKRQKMSGAQLATPEATTLNLRPFYDGKHWELTLTLGSANRTESKGLVAHFTPTL